MTEIKICGITNDEDAALATALNVDALGFIFYPKSPRYIPPDAAKTIIERLREKRPVIVGVFVNEAASDVKATMVLCKLDMIQLHGDESEPYCRQFPAAQLIKALTPEMGNDAEHMRNFPAKAILVDTRDTERYGGTSRPSDWEIARKIVHYHPLVLAGGLSEVNIREAIAMVSPHAVDINSGIESAPGKKDADKMRRIVEIIRAIEAPEDVKDIRIFGHE